MNINDSITVVKDHLTTYYQIPSEQLSFEVDHKANGFTIKLKSLEINPTQVNQIIAQILPDINYSVNIIFGLNTLDEFIKQHYESFNEAIKQTINDGETSFEFQDVIILCDGDKFFTLDTPKIKTNDPKILLNLIAHSRAELIQLSKINPDRQSQEQLIKPFITTYSQRSVAVFGDTYPFRKQLKEIGGKYNKFLSYNEQKTPGWIFSLTKLEALEQLLNTKLDE